MKDKKDEDKYTLMDLPPINTDVLVWYNKGWYKGRMVAKGEPPVWNVEIPGAISNPAPTREIVWWAEVTSPIDKPQGGGPVTRVGGTVIGALKM